MEPAAFIAWDKVRPPVKFGGLAWGHHRNRVDKTVSSFRLGMRWLFLRKSHQMMALAPDENARPQPNGCFQPARANLLPHTVGDIKDVVRLQLHIRRFVFHALLYVEGD